MVLVWNNLVFVAAQIIHSNPCVHPPSYLCVFLGLQPTATSPSLLAPYSKFNYATATSSSSQTFPQRPPSFLSGPALAQRIGDFLLVRGVGKQAVVAAQLYQELDGPNWMMASFKRVSERKKNTTTFWATSTVCRCLCVCGCACECGCVLLRILIAIPLPPIPITEQITYHQHHHHHHQHLVLVRVLVPLLHAVATGHRQGPARRSE